MADGFLGRWSRRKLDVKDGKPLPPEPEKEVVIAAKAAIQGGGTSPAGETAGAATVDLGLRRDDNHARRDDVGAGEPPPLTLDDVKTLTPQGDFKPYMAQGVAPEVKNAAMKKLFADPRFNVMDGLDTYIGDYTQSDPIPAAMLRQMVGSKLLGLFDDEEKKEKEALEKALQARDDADNPPAEIVAQSYANPDIESPGVADTEPASQPGAQPDAQVSQDHDAHTDLRLQPNHAAPAKDAGGGTQ